LVSVLEVAPIARTPLRLAADALFANAPQAVVAIAGKSTSLLPTLR
jgi:hypothetical protein